MNLIKYLSTQSKESKHCVQYEQKIALLNLIVGGHLKLKLHRQVISYCV